MIVRVWMVALSVLLAWGGSGCRHRCCRPALMPEPFLPPPPGGSTRIPPTMVPTTPGASPVFPPPATNRAIPPATSGSIPPPDPLFVTPPSSTSERPPAEVLLPDPLPSSNGKSQSLSPSTPGGLLGEPSGPPSSAEPPLAWASGEAAKPAPGNDSPPIPSGKNANASSRSSERFPDLPGFVLVKEGLATGRLPTPAGLGMLKKSGYRTVVVVHEPEFSLASLQADVEKAGLRLVPVELSAASLPTAVGAFERAIATASVQEPVYVCDRDGLRAGLLWYLHFRSVEVLNADVAMIRARALGFRDDQPEARELLAAARRYLEGP